jgi:hypothetical protein
MVPRQIALTLLSVRPKRLYSIDFPISDGAGDFALAGDAGHSAIAPLSPSLAHQKAEGVPETGAMRMTKSILQIQSMPRPVARSFALAALLVVLVLSVGGALAERMEQRAVEDRLSIGDAAGN